MLSALLGTRGIGVEMPPCFEACTIDLSSEGQLESRLGLLFTLIEESARREKPVCSDPMCGRFAWLELLESYQTRLRRIHLMGRCVSALIGGATRVQQPGLIDNLARQSPTGQDEHDEASINFAAILHDG